MSTTTKLKYNNQDRPEFFKVLNKRVNQYFKDRNISKHANWNMRLKTLFMISLFIGPYILMITGVVTGTWPIMGMWLLMAAGTCGIGLSIMHDANHGAYSKNKKVNNLLGYLINAVGGYHANWKIQHNMLHHSFTNIHGHDEDIQAPLMRFSPDQKRKKLYRFQAFYASFFYGLMTLNWVFSRDFLLIVKYNKRDLLAKLGMTLNQAVAQVVIAKAIYLFAFIALPIILVDLPWWQSVLGFLGMQFITGLVLALIFQPAHVIEETEFFAETESGSMENSWAVHQMKTTANFANRSIFFSWFIGGLNYQIEHHLFPNICHVHYKKISKIVKHTAQEYGVPYYSHRTFVDALKSHFTLLHELGTGKYDRKLVAQGAAA